MCARSGNPVHRSVAVAAALSLRTCIVWVSTFASLVGAFGAAFGQQDSRDGYPGRLVDGPDYALPAAPWAEDPISWDEVLNRPEQAFLSSDTDVSVPDLAKRVSDLEAALKRANDRAQSEEKKAGGGMTMRINGHFMLDGAAFSQDAADKLRFDEENGFNFRSNRLILRGTGADIMSYKVEFDFVHSTVQDLYMNIGELPILGNLRIGHMKEPFSLEQLMSVKYLMFMERSPATGIHFPPRRIGVMAHDVSEDQRMTLAIGLFADNPGFKTVQGDDFGGAVTMRATWLPWYDDATDGRGLVHTGIAYSHRVPFEDTVRFRATPGPLFLTSRAIDTGDILANSVDLLGTELAAVYGPFSVQSEYLLGFIDRISGDSAVIQGVYVQASCFLTGENRNYDKTTATFTRITPFENFFHVRAADRRIQTGKGAWEVKYQYSYMDAFDGGRLGSGQLGSHIMGFNWYLNPYTRLMAEYVLAAISPNDGNPDGQLNIFQMRSQIEF